MCGRVQFVTFQWSGGVRGILIVGLINDLGQSRSASKCHLFFKYNNDTNWTNRRRCDDVGRANVNDQLVRLKDIVVRPHLKL